MHFTLQSEFWSRRYKENESPWDLGEVSPPLKEYFEGIEDQEMKILIPGAGAGYEAAWLHQNGFSNVYYMDFSQEAAEQFCKQNPSFPEKNVLVGDFFGEENSYDLIVEQTFFCAFEPSEENRCRYAEKAYQLLRSGGKLVGLWWNFPIEKDQIDPPYGGSLQEYISLFKPYFSSIRFFPCYNSHPSRQGKEYFAIMTKKQIHS